MISLAARTLYLVAGLAPANLPHHGDDLRLLPGAQDVAQESAHYALHGCRDVGEALELCDLLEQAYAGFADLLGTRPSLGRGEKLKLSLHANRSSWEAGVRNEGEEPATNASDTWVLQSDGGTHVLRGPTAGGTRTSLISGAFQQFHLLSRAKNRDLRRAWFVQGTAQHLALHSWDRHELELGIAPLVATDDFLTPAYARAVPADFRAGRAPESIFIDLDIASALVRYYLDGAGSRVRRKFLRLALGTSGSKLDERTVATTLAQAHDLGAGFLGWLRAAQPPLREERGEWATAGARSVVGGPRTSFALWTDQPERVRVELGIPGKAIGGLLLSWKDRSNFTRVRIQADTLWIDAIEDGVTRRIRELPLEPRALGRWKLTAEAAAGGTELRIDDDRPIHIDVPWEGLGLMAANGEVHFDELRWE